MNDDIRRDILQLLDECRTASLATVDDHGQPCACNVQFAFDSELRLYFISKSDSQHGMNIGAAGEMALTVYVPDDREPGNLRGLQLRGRSVVIARAPGSEAWQRAWKAYAARFPFIEQSPYREAAGRQQMYAVVPSWVRLIDNRQGFGFKRELRL